MAQTTREAEPKLVKHPHPGRPGWDYFLIEPGNLVIAELEKAPAFDTTCTPACTKTMVLVPKRSVAGHTGVGYQMINIDGYRMINAFVISDALNSTTQLGFTLVLS